MMTGLRTISQSTTEVVVCVGSRWESGKESKKERQRERDECRLRRRTKEERGHVFRMYQAVPLYERERAKYAIVRHGAVGAFSNYLHPLCDPFPLRNENSKTKLQATRHKRKKEKWRMAPYIATFRQSLRQIRWYQWSDNGRGEERENTIILSYLIICPQRSFSWEHTHITDKTDIDLPTSATCADVRLRVFRSLSRCDTLWSGIKPNLFFLSVRLTRITVDWSARKYEGICAKAHVSRWAIQHSGIRYLVPFAPLASEVLA